jgi:hypothetical protein
MHEPATSDHVRRYDLSYLTPNLSPSVVVSPV